MDCRLVLPSECQETKVEQAAAYIAILEHT